MVEPVELRLAGSVFDGWTSVSVTRSIETVSGSFELGLTDKWPGQPERRDIAIGQSATVAIGGESIITGFVDDVEARFDAGNHGFIARGRDKTGDLVDCSAMNKPGSWRDRRLERIAEEICAPFGIEVIVATDTGKPFRSFTIEKGETAFEAIERMCRARAVLPSATDAGDLLIMRPNKGAPAAILEEGRDIMSAGILYSTRDRYDAYTVRGQQQGDDAWTGDAAAQPQGLASDPAIKRYRPLLIVAESPGDGLTFTDRARWEASRRAGRGARVTVTLPSWRDGVGRLWRPNALVSMVAPSLNVRRVMLIASVNLRFDEGGQVAALTMMRPEAFETFPLDDEEESGLWN